MDQKHTYGGQAVLEGVMIRGQKHVSVAVRRPDGGIALQCKPLDTLFTGPLRRWPMTRGIIVLVETLALGMRALAYSANVSMEAEGEELGKGGMALMTSLSMLFAILLFFIIPVVATEPLKSVLGSEIATNFVEGGLRLALFLGYLTLISRMAEIRRVFMYHGAEHMTVHAQERGELLEPAVVRKYPTAHPRCGTAFLLVVMVVAVIAFAFVGREPLWWLLASRVLLIPIIAAFSYEVIRLSGKFSDNPLVQLITKPSLALQVLTTRQPTNDQIEVAITAMQYTINADEGRGIPGTLGEVTNVSQVSSTMPTDDSASLP